MATVYRAIDRKHGRAVAIKVLHPHLQIVNLMNTDEPGLRIGADQWDRMLGLVLAARLP